MRRGVLKRIPLRTDPFAGSAEKVNTVLFTLFLIEFLIVWLRLWLGASLFGERRWPEGLFLVLATATTLAWVARQLPGQNVMAASLTIAFIAGAVESIGAVSSIPFGPYLYTGEIGQQLFYPLPWAVPMMWIVMVLISRGVARLILRPWRKVRTYGFWVIGLAVLLVVLLDFGLEPFATRVKHFWLWQATKTPLSWYTAPWVNFLGWAVTTLLILAFATPWLINKKAVKQPPDYQPLILWLLLNFLFGSGAVAQRLWPAVGLVLVSSIVVSIFAVRGARW
jgi:uncharacterized membrane protein